MTTEKIDTLTYANVGEMDAAIESLEVLKQRTPKDTPFWECVESAQLRIKGAYQQVAGHPWGAV